MAAANVPAKGETCLADHSEPIRDTSESSVIDPATGKSWTRVGASPDPQAVRVSLAELLAKPEQFAGRLVHVEGKVTAMCGHRRAWFAIVPEGGPATDPLRIITAPRFLVPSSSIGRVARAEGVVELRELPKATADHIAQEHGLSTPKRAIPLLKASNADFM